LIYLFTWFTNQYLNRLYFSVAQWSQTVSLAGALLAFLAVALIATFRPRLVRINIIVAFAIALYLTGAAFMASAVASDAGWLLALGGFLSNLGAALVRVFACVPLIKLSFRQCATCVACAALAFYAVKAVLEPFAGGAGYMVFLLSTPVTLLLTYSLTKQALVLTQSFLPPATLSVTEPKAFLPFSHVFFVTLFFFYISCGFTSSFNSDAGTPVSTLPAAIPVAAVAIWVLFARKMPTDSVYKVSCLLIFTGFLALILPQFSASTVPNILMAAGVNCSKMLVFYMLAAIGKRNPINALAIFGWGEFAYNAGITVGTSLGNFSTGLIATDYQQMALVVAIFVTFFFAFNLFILRSFSFEGTVQGVESFREPKVTEKNEPQLSDFIDEQCSKVSAGFNLTKREAEVLSLLAHGRNVPYIENLLIISHNTVRTHIKHIYIKLGLHSQQELIDMVETY
jgi:DNA-binding CsgD family transcriptional regulator